MTLALLDWRRRVDELYRLVRSVPDPREGHDLWRAVRTDLLRSHPESPVPPAARDAFVDAVLPYDPALRFEAAVEEGAEPLRLHIPTGTDGTVQLDRIGQVALRDVGTLDVWWVGGYGGGLFLPVRDATAGTRTYGGGRYLLDTLKGADLGGQGRHLVVDLNFAYNPSCAYDPAWACPLAPAGNVLTAAVAGGEQAYDPPLTTSSPT